MVKLTPRLLTAAACVRPGHLLCDVGTDHAYLPIYLCEAGLLSPVSLPGPLPGDDPGAWDERSTLCAVASDINQGPVDRARVHIAAAGLSGRIRTVRTDGLHGLEVCAAAAPDVIIFGMGGELIVSILEAAPWVKDPAVRLILQPMTHPEKLRAYLYESGFSLVGETLSREEERIYQTICVSFDPARPAPAEALTPAALLTGYAYPQEQRPLHDELIRRALRTHTAARDARASAGLDVTEEDALLADLRARLADRAE